MLANHRFSLFFVAVAAALAAPVAAQSSPSPDAADVVAEVQARYGGMRAVRARFEQRFVHRLHDRTERWRGRLAIARPGRVRIDYDRPRGRVVVSDGARMISYEPEPAPGQYWEQEATDDALPVVLGLLTGSATLDAELDARLIDTASTGFAGVVLELRPRRAVPLYDRVLLYVDRSEAHRGRVHRIMIVDHAGNTNRFDLSRHEENARLPASYFSFRPPAAARRIEP